MWFPVSCYSENINANKRKFKMSVLNIIIIAKVILFVSDFHLFTLPTYLTSYFTHEPFFYSART